MVWELLDEWRPYGVFDGFINGSWKDVGRWVSACNLKGVAAERDLVRDFCRPLRDQALNRKRNDDVAGRMKLLSWTRARDFCRLVVVRQRARRRKLRADSIFCRKS